MSVSVLLLTVIFFYHDGDFVISNKSDSASLYLDTSLGGQLIGHRGVVQLPEGYEYRDEACHCQEIGKNHQKVTAGIFVIKIETDKDKLPGDKGAQ